MKGLRSADGQLQLRGHVYALSPFKDHYSRSGRHFSHDPAALHWHPRIWLATREKQWNTTVGTVESWHEQSVVGETRILMPIRYDPHDKREPERTGTAAGGFLTLGKSCKMHPGAHGT